ncbi:MAG: hypothetical protein EPN19_00475, partial [Betaproteobacteria bacterium]
TGYTGSKGNTELLGMAGPTGRTGATGPQGAIGQTGAQGPGGPTGRWTSFREFWFDSNTVSLQTSDSGKVRDIATYLNQNPGKQAGIDGSSARAGSVRSALLQAGVPTYQIQTGAFGDPQLQRDRRVEVLVSNR